MNGALRCANAPYGILSQILLGSHWKYRLDDIPAWLEIGGHCPPYVQVNPKTPLPWILTG